jgi:hypothetical protein
MFGQNFPWVCLYFAKCDSFHAGTLKTQRKSANSGKKIQNLQFFHSVSLLINTMGLAPPAFSLLINSIVVQPTSHHSKKQWKRSDQGAECTKKSPPPIEVVGMGSLFNCLPVFLFDVFGMVILLAAGALQRILNSWYPDPPAFWAS